jgi:hypothetical protein
MEIAPLSNTGNLADPRQIPSLRAARAPELETAPLLGSGERRADAFRVSGRTPLDADRRLAQRMASAEGEQSQDPSSSIDPSQRSGTSEAREASKSSSESARGSKDGKPEEGLTEEQEQQVRQLEKRDAEVRAHEQAHMAAAGAMAQGGPKYSYETGPDGKRYATGGEVNIVMKSGRTPEETIRNAQQVQAAALAPGDPSPTDQQTAAAAARMAQEARQQLAAQSQEKASGKPEGAGPDAPSPSRPASSPVADKEPRGSRVLPGTP